MTLAFHPQAAERFNQQANNFLSRLSDAEPKHTKDQFKDIPVAASLGDDDILDISSFSTIDGTGKKTSVNFFKDGKWIGLSGEAYQDFFAFCEKISQTGPLNGKISTEFTLTESFRWIEDRSKGVSRETYTERIRIKCEEAVRNRTIYFPLEGFYARTTFDFGPFSISHCSPDIYEALFPTISDPEKAQFVAALKEKKRAVFQGKPLARISVEGEPGFVRQKAREVADRVVPVLNLFMGFPFLPGQASFIAPTAFKPRPTYVSINHSEEGLENITSGLLDAGSTPTFTPEMFEHAKASLLFMEVSELLKSPSTDFKKSVADSLRLMGLGCYEANLSNRLVYTMVALESLFMRNDSESIQENVAFRLAVCVRQGPDDRMNVVKNFKQAYDWRSKYIHHGRTVEIRDELKTFFMWAFFGILAAVRNTNRFSTKEDFIAQIERQKFT